MAERTGGCLCGAVRYRLTAEPKYVTHCHCADCRRSTGAPFVTWASVSQAHLVWEQGEPRTIQWAERLRTFCPHCGTALTFAYLAKERWLDVTVASLDAPELLHPQYHVWVEDKLPWVQLGDRLPQYPREREP